MENKLTNPNENDRGESAMVVTEPAPTPQAKELAKENFEWN